MEPRRLIALVRAWLPLMIVAAALAGAAGYGVSKLQPKVYEADATLIVGQALSATNPDYTQLLVAQTLSSTYATVAHTRPLMQQVIDKLHLTVSPDDLLGRIKVDAPPNGNTLTITVQDTDAQRAANIANSLSAALIAASPGIQGREQQFQQSIDQGLSDTQKQIEATQQQVDSLVANPSRTAAEEAELGSLQSQLATLRSTYATLLGFSSGAATNSLQVIEPATVPTEAVLPRTLLNTLLAAALGLIVILGVAFLADQLDDSIKDAEAVRELTGLSTLGTIGRMRSAPGRSEIYQLAGLLYPRSTVTESYRTLRTNIEFASVDAPLQTLLVTSATPREGKTVTASNLAVVFAQAGRNVILVDADLRKPGVDSIFRLDNTAGLTTLLRGDAGSIDQIAHATEQVGLRVLTTGPLPPNPAELLGSQRMVAVMKVLKDNADIVIFDSPPLRPVTDAAVLGSIVDGTILVVDASRSHQKPVRLAREALTHAGANVLGAVLNRVGSSDKVAYGGYYGSESEARDDASGPPADSGTPQEPAAISAKRPRATT